MKPTSLRLLATTLALGALSLGAACEDEDPGFGGIGPDGGGSDAASADLPPMGAVGLAVVNSDGKATNVSQVDPATGMMSRASCVSSSTVIRLPLALSGDVVLPSQQNPTNDLVLVDRATGAVSWIDPRLCNASRQLSVKTGFAPMPHDVVPVSHTKAYVTRYEKNATPTADPADFDEGDDLLIIDSAGPAVLGRIDMGPSAAPVAGQAIQARPDRAIRLAGKVYVTLGSTTRDGMTAGAGRLAIVDTATDQVTGTIELAGLKGCSALSYNEVSNTLYVVCGGSPGDGAMQVAGSAIVAIDIAASPPAVKRTIPAAMLGGRPLSRGGVASMGNDAAVYVVVEADPSGSPPAQVWAFDLITATARKLQDASSAAGLGGLVTDLRKQRLYVPDGNPQMPRLLVFDASNTGVPALSNTYDPNPGAGLSFPPRQIAWH